MSDKPLLFSLLFGLLTSKFLNTSNLLLIFFFFHCILCSNSCSALMSFIIVIYSCDWVFSYIFVYSNQLSVVLAPCWTSSRPKSIMLCKRPLWSSGISSANTPTSQSITLIWTIFIDTFSVLKWNHSFFSLLYQFKIFSTELVTMHSGIVLSVKNTCLRIRLKWSISELLKD